MGKLLPTILPLDVGIWVALYLGVPLFLQVSSLVAHFRRGRSVLLVALFLLLTPLFGLVYPFVIWRRQGWTASRLLLIPYALWVLTLVSIPLCYLLLLVHADREAAARLTPLGGNVWPADRAAAATAFFALALTTSPALLALIYSAWILRRQGWGAWAKFLTPYAVWVSLVVLGVVLGLHLADGKPGRRLSNHELQSSWSVHAHPRHSHSLAGLRCPADGHPERSEGS